MHDPMTVCFDVPSYKMREKYHHWEVVVDALTNDERAAARAGSFLDRLYDLIKRRKDDEAADLVYDHLHTLLTENEYAACSDIFRLADVKKLSTATMRSLLSITFRDRVRIWTRPRFHEAAWVETASRQDQKRANRLLGHLR